jgi:probable F420-dependent oxidoreductase
MDLGFAVPLAGSWATPANQVLLAQRAEDLGYASLWTFQRLLYPADTGQSDAPRRWSPVYRSVGDPLVALAYLAARTDRVRLGVAVLNMPWFSPLLLAKQTASLDAVSGGRLDVGLGLGWAAEEYAATGAPMDQRGARAEEFVACLRACWTDPVVDFHGRFHDVGPAYVDPKPVQRPHPPIVVGAAATQVHIDHIIEYADGWMPLPGRFPVADGWAKVLAAADAAGRDRSTLQLGVFGADPDPANLDGLRQLGANWVTLNLDAMDRDRALEQLDAYAPLVTEFNG